ncbi:hypothetical protein ACFFX0_04735 [Citricoccus parietis]|uniref:Uncharacterized protein n=1 Tax=Citricoccus parietis TaxID=592307 RepID=A0ABV5FV26_9MICC
MPDCVRHAADRRRWPAACTPPPAWPGDSSEARPWHGASACSSSPSRWAPWPTRSTACWKRTRRSPSGLPWTVRT